MAHALDRPSRESTDRVRPIVNDYGQVRVLSCRNKSWLSLEGRLAAGTVADVRLALHEAVDVGHGDLIVDLARVEVDDATVLGVLVGAHRRAQRAGRRLVLREVPPRLSRMLMLTRLSRILHVEATLPDLRASQAG